MIVSLLAAAGLGLVFYLDARGGSGSRVLRNWYRASHLVACFSAVFVAYCSYRWHHLSGVGVFGLLAAVSLALLVDNKEHFSQIHPLVNSGASLAFFVAIFLLCAPKAVEDR